MMVKMGFLNRILQFLKLIFCCKTTRKVDPLSEAENGTNADSKTNKFFKRFGNKYVPGHLVNIDQSLKPDPPLPQEPISTISSRVDESRKSSLDLQPSDDEDNISRSSKSSVTPSVHSEIFEENDCNCDRGNGENFNYNSNRCNWNNNKCVCYRTNNRLTELERVTAVKLKPIHVHHNAKSNHILFTTDFSKKAAIDKSVNRYNTNTNINTVFNADPSDFSHCRTEPPVSIRGHPYRTNEVFISNKPVMTLQCFRDLNGNWNAHCVGKVHAVFYPEYHFPATIIKKVDFL